MCPLDWGLGHATRMVTVIDLLLDEGVNVIIAADKGPLDFLKRRFPKCEFIRLAGFIPTYSPNRSMALQMVMKFPEMKRQAKKANADVNRIIDEKNIDIIISDNRYEVNSPKVYSIIISHQIRIITKGIQKLFDPFIKWQINSYLRKFNELWIPDFENTPWLSGSLSHNIIMPIKEFSFIGPLSRFQGLNPRLGKAKYDLMVILSGPEPQRSIFAALIEEQIVGTKYKVVFLLGEPANDRTIINNNIVKIPHLEDVDFAKLIMESDLIISRPGYSTVMDLSVFGKNAVFIPTPGQTEQEYLAETLKAQGVFYCQHQDKLDLLKAIKESKNYSGIKLTNDLEVLKVRIKKLLD